MPFLMSVWPVAIQIRTPPGMAIIEIRRRVGHHLDLHAAGQLHEDGRAWRRRPIRFAGSALPGAKPWGGASVARRHRYSRLMWTSARRAASVTLPPGPKASASKASF
jgi:hypothetical protein